MAVPAAPVTPAFPLAAALAPWLAPHDPFDPASLSLMDAFTPPARVEGRTAALPLGTDDQGCDVLSAIMYGARISLVVGVCATLLSVVLGVALGVTGGHLGGWYGALVMRLADIQLTIPTILVALVVDGAARAALGGRVTEAVAVQVLVLSIGVSNWPQHARVTGGGALVERRREYVAAARLTGVHPAAIMLRHVLPNVLGPVLVLATIGLALAIIIEATLSFLGASACRRPSPRSAR